MQSSRRQSRIWRASSMPAEGRRWGAKISQLWSFRMRPILITTSNYSSRRKKRRSYRHSLTPIFSRSHKRLQNSKEMQSKWQHTSSKYIMTYIEHFWHHWQARDAFGGDLGYLPEWQLWVPVRIMGTWLIYIHLLYRWRKSKSHMMKSSNSLRNLESHPHNKTNHSPHSPLRNHKSPNRQ